MNWPFVGWWIRWLDIIIKKIYWIWVSFKENRLIHHICVTVHFLTFSLFLALKIFHTLLSLLVLCRIDQLSQTIINTSSYIFLSIFNSDVESWTHLSVGSGSSRPERVQAEDGQQALYCGRLVGGGGGGGCSAEVIQPVTQTADQSRASTSPHSTDGTVWLRVSRAETRRAHLVSTLKHLDILKLLTEIHLGCKYRKHNPVSARRCTHNNATVVMHQRQLSLTVIVYARSSIPFRKTLCFRWK